MLLFAFYLFKLHSLSVEGNAIFSYRCANVNPHLIGYKKSFLNFADAIRHPEGYVKGDLQKYYEGYISEMRAYVPEENKWLAMDRNFMDRWDIKLIAPWYLREGGELQWKMFEAYRDHASAMIAVVDNGGSTDEIKAKSDDAVNRRDEYIDLYNMLSDKVYSQGDWRFNFTYVPPADGCTPENTTIPSTVGVFDVEQSPKTIIPEITS